MNFAISWIAKWISFWIFRLSLFFHAQMVVPSSIVIAPPIQTPDEIYSTPKILQFERKFATLSDANVTGTLFTQPYDVYWKHVSETKDNELECTWRRRLLMEFTPRGMVLMYYDAFKRGFAYYSDTYLPYAILNVVAMKYVATYHCRAFFVDEDYFPEGHTSPILSLDQKDASAPPLPPLSKDNKHKITEGPFLQPKKIPPSTTTKQQEQPIKTKELCKNRFLNLGKIVNCQLLPPPPPPSKKHISTPTSYADYKSWARSVSNNTRQQQPTTELPASQIFDAINQ